MAHIHEQGEPPLPPLRGSFSPSNYDAGLPSRPTGSWKRTWLLEEETFFSWQVSRQENYCCSMGMGIPSSPMPWTAEIDAP